MHTIRLVARKPNKEAVTIAKGLWSTISCFGLPKIVQSDNGTEFVNKILKSLFDIESIDQQLITSNHARPNGAAERMVQTSSQAVYKLLDGRTVPAVQLFKDLLKRLTYMNNIVYPAIDDHTKKTMSDYRNQFAKKKLIIKDKYPDGCLVMARNELRTAKVEERYTGPFKVKGRSANGTYMLGDAIGIEFKIIKNTQKVHSILEKRKD
jgi:transposase InsO family protein